MGRGVLRMPLFRIETPFGAIFKTQALLSTDMRMEREAKKSDDSPSPNEVLRRMLNTPPKRPLRWSRYSRQFGGWVKVDRVGVCAASLFIFSVVGSIAKLVGRPAGER
jgi:hypothetical protein